jgi:hypothetical protein
MTGRVEPATYTLNQLVSRLSVGGGKEEAARLARQLRHWTSSDLISPLGEKHTGTGVSRRYTADEVRKAAILVELSRYRIPAPVLEESFSEAAENWVKERGWRDAISGARPILLFMSQSEDLIAYQLVARGAIATMLDPVHDPKRDPMFEIFSAVVINLTRLFARLRV